jgi:hypothetical protein
MQDDIVPLGNNDEKLLTDQPTSIRPTSPRTKISAFDSQLEGIITTSLQPKADAKIKSTPLSLIEKIKAQVQSHDDSFADGIEKCCEDISATEDLEDDELDFCGTDVDELITYVYPSNGKYISYLSCC